MTKLKIAILVILLAAGALAFLFFRDYLQTSLREKDDALLQQSNRIAQLEAENERLSSLVANATNTMSPATDASRELLRLRGEVGLLRQQNHELLLRQQANDSATQRKEDIKLPRAVAESGTNPLSPEDQLSVRQAEATEAMTTVLQAIKNYTTIYSGQYPPSLGDLFTSGALPPAELPGNLGLGEFELGQGGADSQGAQSSPTLSLSIPKPGGGTIMIVGGLTAAGVPFTSSQNVGP